jgi:hypothetical protein
MIKRQVLAYVFWVSVAGQVLGGPMDDSSALRVSFEARSKIAVRSPVKILCIGDSMSDVGYNYPSISKALMSQMRDAYGDGGQGLDGWDLGGNRPEIINRPVPAGFFFGITATLYPGDHINSIQGGTNYYNDRSGWLPDHPYNRAGLFWYSFQGGGSFKVGITNLLTRMADRTEIVLSSYSPLPAIHYTNWPVSPSGRLALWATGITGTNYLIGPEMANTNSGVEAYFFSRGGGGLTQWLSLGTNLLGQLWSAVSPDLVIYHAKDCGPPPDLPPDKQIISSTFTSFLSTLTNTTRNIIVVGTPPAGSFDVENAVQNEAEKSVADANEFGFVDLYSGFSDFTKNQAAGMMYDQTHPSESGAVIWANEMARQLGFDGLITHAALIRGDHIILEWSTIPGHDYQVESRNTSDAAWSDFGARVVAAANIGSISIPIAGTSSALYRIRLLH